MPSPKLKYFQTIAEQTAHDITTNPGSWTSFLDTAARLYKYSFPEQLLIYAQRPDAASCAAIEVWNNDGNKRDFDGQPWHRFVKRGSKGIALIDDAGSYPRLKYVFDIADTYSAQRHPQRERPEYKTKN